MLTGLPNAKGKLARSCRGKAPGKVFFPYHTTARATGKNTAIEKTSAAKRVSNKVGATDGRQIVLIGVALAALLVLRPRGLLGEEKMISRFLNN